MMEVYPYFISTTFSIGGITYFYTGFGNMLVISLQGKGFWITGILDYL
jgi:hypothetical protein